MDCLFVTRAVKVRGHCFEHGRHTAPQIRCDVMPRVVSIIAEIRMQGPPLFTWIVACGSCSHAHETTGSTLGLTAFSQLSRAAVCARSPGPCGRGSWSER